MDAGDPELLIEPEMFRERIHAVILKP